MSHDTNEHDDSTEHSHESIDAEHIHEATSGEPLTECPACGKPIEGVDDLERGETVPEITSMEKRSVMVGRKSNDLWMCEGCGATLGVRIRD
ncbi:hypothetical protein E6P09_11615 [Haloferax mediterranei ATCC 33500]|uniref:Small CPxCG-related zinc finger protein n=1 Tax=Haloferax mediterranei (strain ATCC 33500 / DSM 1411 / JCM 8866 / NBRC 14739 / NCIMB 2177 / R-4) TaxID=523841 RepID=I3R5B4_HALMT|nr:hypothetical protein [Haloferax mediterranei]AFK19424.1 hypothetical protein HFX_1718 [Haloferax mediterranei ATCC 33500]AHZ21225.1 hypothetical protein BM92_00515 [Haloferax mediterranei ATCC 33500]EMA04386.1 hypothetical protein C439_01887 [Haloferax mediterranei ATCC 33500]MDX5989529.1 hypothetical protein [Haloferax mediterranei ATCC 33500]QCQ75886.1 hypothetical protein E6P09_11615 [Haloferax mediterranei ATCC 33500]